MFLGLYLLACQTEESSFAMQPSNGVPEQTSEDTESDSQDFETKWCRVDRVEYAYGTKECEWSENTSTCTNGDEVETKTYNDYGEILEVEYSMTVWASGTNTYDCQDFTGTGVWCHTEATAYGEGDTRATTVCEMEDLVSNCIRTEPSGEFPFTIEYNEYGTQMRWLDEQRAVDDEAVLDCSGFPAALSKRQCKVLHFISRIDDIVIEEQSCTWEGTVQTCEVYDFFEDSTKTVVTHYNNQGYATKTYENNTISTEIFYTNCD
jgi:hypothetical protein